MIAILRQVVLIEHKQTGRPVQEILQELLAFLRGAKVPFPGERVKCRVCGSQRTYVNRTARDDLIITRFHCCNFCGWHFQSVEQTEIEEKKSGKTPDRATRKPRRR